MDKEFLCLIPRNLNKPDVIIQKPIELTWKQIGYIAAGVAGSYLIIKSGFPIVYKVVGTAISLSSGIFGALYKPDDMHIDEIAVDSLTYLHRKVYYNGLKGSGIHVTIAPKKEEVTVEGIKTTSFSVRPAST